MGRGKSCGGGGGRGEAKGGKGTPAVKACYFAKLRSPTNGVADWRGMVERHLTLVNQKSGRKSNS